MQTQSPTPSARPSVGEHASYLIDRVSWLVCKKDTSRPENGLLLSDNNGGDSDSESHIIVITKNVAPLKLKLVAGAEIRTNRPTE
jgi:hypothetical protein